MNAFKCIVSGCEMFDCFVCEVEYANEAYSTEFRKSAESANGIICKRRAAYKTVSQVIDRIKKTYKLDLRIEA